MALSGSLVLITISAFPVGTFVIVLTSGITFTICIPEFLASVFNLCSSKLPYTNLISNIFFSGSIVWLWVNKGI